MEISDVSDKEFKVMGTKFRGTMYEQSENFNKDRKYKKIPNRNHRAEEYNN